MADFAKGVLLTHTMATMGILLIFQSILKRLKKTR